MNCAAHEQLVGQAGTLDVRERLGQEEFWCSQGNRAACWESHKQASGRRRREQELHVESQPCLIQSGREPCSLERAGVGMKGSRLLVRLSRAFFILVLGGALQQTSGGSEAAVRHRQPGWPPSQLQEH